MYIYIYILFCSPPASAAATLLWHTGEAAQLWSSGQEGVPGKIFKNNQKEIKKKRKRN